MILFPGLAASINYNSPLVTPACQDPNGFLQSQFIVPAAEQHLKYANNSVLSPLLDSKHPPVGLYVLLLTAVSITLCVLTIFVNY